MSELLDLIVMAILGSPSDDDKEENDDDDE